MGSSPPPFLSLSLSHSLFFLFIFFPHLSFIVIIIIPIFLRVCVFVSIEALLCAINLIIAAANSSSAGAIHHTSSTWLVRLMSSIPDDVANSSAGAGPERGAEPLQKPIRCHPNPGCISRLDWYCPCKDARQSHRYFRGIRPTSLPRHFIWPLLWSLTTCVTSTIVNKYTHIYLFIFWVCCCCCCCSSPPPLSPASHSLCLRPPCAALTGGGGWVMYGRSIDFQRTLFFLFCSSFPPLLLLLAVVVSFPDIWGVPLPLFLLQLRPLPPPPLLCLLFHLSCRCSFYFAVAVAGYFRLEDDRWFQPCAQCTSLWATDSNVIDYTINIEERERK